jgi:hypothetical protein
MACVVWIGPWRPFYPGGRACVAMSTIVATSCEVFRLGSGTAEDQECRRQRRAVQVVCWSWAPPPRGRTRDSINALEDPNVALSEDPSAGSKFRLR